MDTSQPLPPVTLPFISQWAHEQSSHSGRDRSYAWVQQHNFKVTKAHLAITTPKHPIWQQQRPVLGPWYYTIFQVDQPATWREAGPLPLWKQQCFVLTGMDTHSGYRLSFSAKTTIFSLAESTLSPIMIIHANVWQLYNCHSELIILDKFRFKKKKVSVIYTIFI